MEMIAVINGLRSLKRPCSVMLFTDSQSVVRGISERVAEWKQIGWRKSVNSKKYVQNLDLWMHLAKQCSRHTVEAKWVKGHAGHIENERCDKLARGEARKAIENLENSAQKDGVGADALLADWVSPASVPAAPAPASRPVAKQVEIVAPAIRRALAADRAPTVGSARPERKEAPPAPAHVEPSRKDAKNTASLFPQLQPKPPPAPPAKIEGPVVDLFTDGACIGNPGPGGWAFILRHRTSKIEKAASGGIAHTTNNRMEVMAVIKGLGALKRPCLVHVFTDSQYVAKGISDWSPKWKKFGWRKTLNAKLNVRNADLWARLDELAAKHTIVPQWVRGHSGHAENERCDQMAEREARAVAQDPGKAPVDAIEDGED
jgi:ribonuclease HI